MNVIAASRQRWKIVLGGLMLTPGLYQLLIPAATNLAFTMFAVLCSLGALVFTAGCALSHLPRPLGMDGSVATEAQRLGGVVDGAGSLPVVWLWEAPTGSGRHYTECGVS